MTEQTQEPEWHGVLAFVVGQAGTHGCTSDRRASESKYTIAIVKPWASGMEAPTPPGWKTSSKGRRSGLRGSRPMTGLTEGRESQVGQCYGSHASFPGAEAMA